MEEALFESNLRADNLQATFQYAEVGGDEGVEVNRGGGGMSQ